MSEQSEQGSANNRFRLLQHLQIQLLYRLFKSTKEYRAVLLEMNVILGLVNYNVISNPIRHFQLKKIEHV